MADIIGMRACPTVTDIRPSSLRSPRTVGVVDRSLLLSTMPANLPQMKRNGCVPRRKPELAAPETGGLSGVLTRIEAIPMPKRKSLVSRKPDSMPQRFP
jgi:hypothetical protein